MVEENYSTMESNTSSNEDPFHNEHTQRLFEAIDELRSCGADTDIGYLPEVSHVVPNRIENPTAEPCLGSSLLLGINLLGNLRCCKV